MTRRNSSASATPTSASTGGARAPRASPRQHPGRVLTCSGLSIPHPGTLLSDIARDPPVYGSREFWVNEDALVRQRNLVTGPYRELEVDAGHFVLEERPDEVAAAVLEHLAHAP